MAKLVHMITSSPVSALPWAAQGPTCRVTNIATVLACGWIRSRPHSP